MNTSKTSQRLWNLMLKNVEKDESHSSRNIDHKQEENSTFQVEPIEKLKGTLLVKKVIPYFVLAIAWSDPEFDSMIVSVYIMVWDRHNTAYCNIAESREKSQYSASENGVSYRKTVNEEEWK